jgi:hypothetical protein
MEEHHRLRLERLTARYARRIGRHEDASEAEFLCAFDDLRTRILRPVLEEFAVELRRAGHDARILVDEGHDPPSIELALGLRGGRDAPDPARDPSIPRRPNRNVIGFSVIRWSGYPLQILAYLEASPPPFDLERFARASDLAKARVEQLVVDAIEHVLACNAP